MKKKVLFGLMLAYASFSAAAESWQEALRHMPLRSNTRELNRTNCVGLMLDSFASNELVKALIFMPGATDEFYMFRRAKAALPAGTLTLLDAVSALTNQTLIRASFRAPLLLLHTDEDPLDPLLDVTNRKNESRLRQLPFVPHALYNDRDWDFMQPILKRSLKADVQPWRYRYDSWHFYRHSFAGWNLTGWEALEATALAGKTRVTIPKRTWLGRTLIIFEGDERVRATPRIETVPK